MTILMIMQIEIIEHAQLNGNPNTPPLSATEAVFWIFTQSKSMCCNSIDHTTNSAYWINWIYSLIYQRNPLLQISAISIESLSIFS